MLRRGLASGYSLTFPTRIAQAAQRYADSVKKERKLLSEAETKAREERLKAMGVEVEHPTTSTITTFTKHATEEFDEFAPERDDDGTGVDE